MNILLVITPENKHINCHAGLDPASSPILDSRFRGNDGFDIYCCRSNNSPNAGCSIPGVAKTSPGKPLSFPPRLYGREDLMEESGRFSKACMMLIIV